MNYALKVQLVKMENGKEVELIESRERIDYQKHEEAYQDMLKLMYIIEKVRTQSPQEAMAEADSKCPMLN